MYNILLRDSTVCIIRYFLAKPKPSNKPNQSKPSKFCSLYPLPNDIQCIVIEGQYVVYHTVLAWWTARGKVQAEPSQPESCDKLRQIIYNPVGDQKQRRISIFYFILLFLHNIIPTMTLKHKMPHKNYQEKCSWYLYSCLHKTSTVNLSNRTRLVSRLTVTF